MRTQRNAATEVFNNPILIGTITLLVVVVAVYLSYIAENGLPFVPTYNVNVDVQNGAELVKNADVRIGGARVGQVLTITPEVADPTDKAWPHPFARLKLSLQKSLEPLPENTHYQVRLASVLGGKYVELIPPAAGQPKGAPLPDGGTLTLARGLAEPFVDLDTAFRTFGPKTQSGIRHLLGALGDGFAGRGTQLNNAAYSLSRLLPPLDRFLQTLAHPNTHLDRFISGAAATTSALAGVAPTVTALLSDSAVTFAAISNASLGQTIDQLPPTESVATTVFEQSQPVLADAAAIVNDLKPGATLLPPAARGLDAIVLAATPVFRQVPSLAGKLGTTAASAQRLARDPASTQTFQVLGSSDLATFGSSAFVGLGALLRSVSNAQFYCNITGPWLRNFASTLSEGDSAGTWVRFMPLLGLSQTFEASTPAPDLHTNPYPIEDKSQCQAGNEGFGPGRVIGNPGTTSTNVDATTPPPGVLELGRQKGLVP